MTDDIDPDEMVEGKLVLGGADELAIKMSRAHWAGLHWMFKNEDETGEIAMLLHNHLEMDRPENMGDDEAAAVFVEVFIKKVFATSD